MQPMACVVFIVSDKNIIPNSNAIIGYVVRRLEALLGESLWLPRAIIIHDKTCANKANNITQIHDMAEIFKVNPCIKGAEIMQIVAAPTVASVLYVIMYRGFFLVHLLFKNRKIAYVIPLNIPVMKPSIGSVMPSVLELNSPAEADKPTNNIGENIQNVLDIGSLSISKANIGKKKI